MLEETRAYRMVMRAKRLSHMKAWLDVFDNQTKALVIEWVQKDQLTAKGIDGKGRVIGTYSYTTQLITNGRKQQGDHYTLNDTGAFYRSMEVLVFQTSFVVLGDGDKGEDDLYEKYGNKITTLNDENLDKFRKIVRQKYLQYARDILFKD